MSDEPGFLARWSRRKRGLERDQVEPPPLAPAPATTPTPPFDPASLPPIDTLTVASDIAAFLRAEVPAALRNCALRRIWSLDPTIRDFVGPADYAWDFNAPDGVPGFAGSLAGEVKDLLAQAIGLTEPSPEASLDEPEAEPVPETTWAEAPPAVPIEPPAAVPEPEPAPPRRRHGGAVPV